MKSQLEKSVCCTICECDTTSFISIQGTFLCEQCERQVVNTDPIDPAYQDFVQKLKSSFVARVY